MRRNVHSERGFTLPELMIVIVLLGILAAIAMPSWFGLINGKKAISAANQVSADMRLAHGTARNRLTTVQFQINTATNCYKVVDGAQTKNRCLPEGSKFVTSVTVVEFRPDGTAQITGSGNVGVARQSASTSEYRIEINTQTSRVKVVSL